MKDRLERTKVVLRHLPPVISEAALMEQIDGKFSGRYNWVRFRPGKNSQKNQRYSRAYIDLKSAEDVVEFAELFDGHIFVNEKGAQCKAMVEYAPSQRVPNQSSKKDGREGTILKDPEYLEFLELLTKPVENLPSAEIQLERKEAERSGVTKETFIVTPLMNFVRQRRAAKSGSQRAIANGKVSRSGVVSTSSSSPSSKRGSEKRRGPTLMYVSKDTNKSGRVKDKSTYILVSRKEQKLLDRQVEVTSATGTEMREDEAVTAMNGSILRAPGVEIEKRKVVLLKGKEKDNSQVSGSSVRSTGASSMLRQNQRQDASGRIIKSILSHKEGQQLSMLNMEKDKRPPRPPNTRTILKDHSPSNLAFASVSDSDSTRYIDDNVTLNEHSSVPNSEKQDRRTRNRDRPDRGVWAPLRRTDGSHSSEESRSSSSLSAQMSSDSLDSIQTTETKARTDDIIFGYGGMKNDVPSSSRSAEIKNLRSARNNIPLENGSQKHVGRRGTGSVLKEVDSSLSLVEGKPLKKGSSGYGSHERQIWVQKSGSAS